MLKFTNAILKQNGLLRKLPNSDFFIVEKSFMYYVDYDNKNYKIIIPKWFKTLYKNNIIGIIHLLILKIKLWKYGKT